MRIVAWMLLALPLCAAAPDKGGLALSPIDVTEPHQSALIAWDGKTEILYISSVLQPKSKTKILEIFPLPSVPAVEPADPQVILRAVGLYNAKVKELRDRERWERTRMLLISIGVLILLTLPVVIWVVMRLRQKRFVDALLGGGIGVLVAACFGGVLLPGMLAAQRAGSPPGGVEVLSHRQLGPHGLTVIKANQPDEISTWIEGLIKSEKGDISAFDAGWRELLASYVKDGYPYFAVDLIDADPASGPIAPIRYTFASDAVYFPLRISSRGKGDTQATLVVLENSGGMIENNDYTKWTRSGWFYPLHPSKDELRQVDGSLADFFGNSEVAMRCVQIQQKLEDLKTDFILKPYKPKG